jgi:hypothetical protein
VAHPLTAPLVAINVGEMQVQAVVTLPALPVRVAAAGMKWATDRIGPVAWVIVAVLIGGAPRESWRL